jgi:hypothetical protein
MVTSTKEYKGNKAMPHKATKVNQGEYHYRGFFIEQRETREWFVGDVRDYIAHDVTDTLREAKELVDYYLSK